MNRGELLKESSRTFYQIQEAVLCKTAPRKTLMEGMQDMVKTIGRKDELIGEVFQ